MCIRDSNNIINLDDFGCPKNIPYLFHGTECLRHFNSSDRCANYKVHAIREWMIHDFCFKQTFLM